MPFILSDEESIFSLFRKVHYHRRQFPSKFADSGKSNLGTRKLQVGSKDDQSLKLVYLVEPYEIANIIPFSSYKDSIFI